MDLVGGVYFSKLFDLVQPWNILADVDLPTSRLQFFSQVRSASGRLFVFSAVKASERVRALLVAPAKNKSNEVTSFWREFTGFTSKLLLRSQIFWETAALVMGICTTFTCFQTLRPRKRGFLHKTGFSLSHRSIPHWWSKFFQIEKASISITSNPGKFGGISTSRILKWTWLLVQATQAGYVRDRN